MDKEYAPGWMTWHARPTRQEIVDQAIAKLRADLAPLRTHLESKRP